MVDPKDFASRVRSIVDTLEGDARHCALDALVTELLTDLGYGEGMAIFLAQVSPYHDASAL